MNKVCELLKIRHPVIQGGMTWVSDAVLAAAVSEGGGFGIIASGSAPADWLRAQVNRARELTARPFGVNVVLLSPHVDEIMDVICQERVAAVTTGAGNPGKYIDLLKKSGVIVMPVISSVALAKRVESYGADAVIAEGYEAGGHIGELSSMVIVPQIADAVKIPVIAAGGIADERGVMAAFALGADGIQVGTRFICSQECTVHDNYKQMIINAKDRSAVVCGRYTGHPVRALKNKLIAEFNKLEQSKASAEEFEALGVGALQKAAVDGDVVFGSVMAGQSAALINDIQPCADIIKNLMRYCDASEEGF